jgi:hypothetical protein
MTPGDTKNVGNTRVPGNLQELDLSSVYGFEHATDWVRENVLLSRKRPHMLELRVKLPAGPASKGKTSATIVMDPRNAYVVGFRGRDGMYLLRDDSANLDLQLRQANLIGKDEKAVTLNIGTDHASLGTFRPILGRAGMRPRDFDAVDLSRVASLSTFSSKTAEVTHAEVSGAISLLVCMLPESARSRMVELSFRGLYFNLRVSADEAMQSYDHAKRITALANKLFKDPVLAYRVERFEKRGQEISSLLEACRGALDQNRFNRKDFLSRVLRGDTAGYPKDLASRVQRLGGIAAELGATVDELSEMAQLCSNKDAVRAAKGGVVVPPIL